jgi:hypothetical protein
MLGTCIGLFCSEEQIFLATVYDISTIFMCSLLFVHLMDHILCIIFSGSAAQRGLWPPRSRGFRDHTPRRATVCRTPLDE